MKRLLGVLGLGLFLCTSSGYAHEALDTEALAKGEIGITEKTGRTIPSDITFRDEKGQVVKLGDLSGKPVILTLVYYTCERICPQLIAGLAAALPRLSSVAGQDYRVASVSFDDKDTPPIAANIRRNYLKPTGDALAPEAWTFLTGDHANIDRLTEAVGFKYRRDVHGFNHPVVLIFLSPQGKISRYFTVTKYQYGAAYPISFSSFELNVALAEAREGKPVSELKKAVLYCFSHEPPGQSKFYYFIGVIGLFTLLVLIAFFIYLQATTKKRRKDGPT
ncbi:MAG: SCO family protein [Deltaproteobacteria bacterium]|nr:SCO family protein [Deltaproteobacteria bacterium]